MSQVIGQHAAFQLYRTQLLLPRCSDMMIRPVCMIWTLFLGLMYFHAYSMDGKLFTILNRCMEYFFTDASTMRQETISIDGRKKCAFRMQN